MYVHLYHCWWTKVADWDSWWVGCKETIYVQQLSIHIWFSYFFERKFLFFNHEFPVFLYFWTTTLRPPCQCQNLTYIYVIDSMFLIDFNWLIESALLIGLNCLYFLVIFIDNISIVWGLTNGFNIRCSTFINNQCITMQALLWPTTVTTAICKLLTYFNNTQLK